MSLKSFIHEGYSVKNCFEFISLFYNKYSYNMRRINIDWLQVSAKGIMAEHSDINIIVKDFQTRHFKCVADIEVIGVGKVGTIMHTPHSKVLDRDLHVFKLDNQFCYRESPIRFTCDLLRKLGLEPKGITRLDLAIDFNRFDYRNTKPEEFIRRFIGGRYLKLGKQNKYKLQGTQEENKNTHVFEYLRFGGNNSPVSVYMYNKSKEMDQVRFKPYIKDRWDQDKLNTEEDVWRLEVSIKGNQLKVADRKTAEIINVSLYELYIREDLLEKLFNAVIAKYFRFKVNDDNVNKSRMNDIALFKDVFHDPDDIIIDREKKDHTRADKIFIRKLENVNNELRENPENYDPGLSDKLKELQNWFIASRSLQGYYNNVVLSSDANFIIPVTELSGFGEFESNNMVPGAMVS
jgi:hypothetical protein